MSDRNTEFAPRHDDSRALEDALDQDTVVSETDVASAGRSCLALLALFVIIIVLLAIWLLYRSTT